MTARLVLRRGTVALLCALLTLAPLGIAQAAGPRTNTEQLPGETPVAAAIAWSQRTFADGAVEDVLLGRDDRFPDNLASGAPQGVLNAPLLLNPSSRLHADVSAELDRLGAVTVHILGGSSAIDDSVEQALRAEGYRTHRHSGTTRIETAIAVAREHAASADTAIVSRAFGTETGNESAAWADAMGAGGWSAQTGWPVLLTETERLTPSLGAYLRESNIKKVFVIGGSAAVSSQTVNEISALGIAVERVSGPNRFDTATRIAVRRGFADADAAQRVILAEGEDAAAWAGGFTAAAHAKRHAAPIVLANGTGLPPETEAYLAPGDDDTALWCGPFTSPEACDAGGAELNQAVTGVVTLDATTVARDGSLSGTVRPMTDVTGAAVRGDCVSGQAVPLAEDGRFSVALHASSEADECAITFSVSHDDGRTVEQPFTLALTAAPSVSGAPELVRVETVSTSNGVAKLRYVFDEAVAQADADAADFVAAFRIVTPDTALSFGATSASVSGGVATAVDVEFAFDAQAVLQRYGLATLATVDGGAVHDRDTLPNPAASFALKGLDVAAGRTLGPDLTAVSGDAATYTFTFDQALNADPVASGLVLVRADGTTSAATSAVRVSDDARRVTATFAAAVDATTVRRAVVLDSAEVCATVEAATRCSELQALDLASGGVTALPDLVSVSLDTVNSRVSYTFDDGVSAPDADSFVVVSFPGGQSAGTEVAATSADGKTVTVQFPAGVVGEPLVLAGALPGAVQAFGRAVPADAVGFARSYAAGTSFGPQLASASAEATELLSGRTRHTVTYVFDMPVALPGTDLAYDGFFLHSEQGDRVAPDGCVRVADAQVRCDFTFDAGVGDAVLATVERGSVVNDGATAGGLEFPNAAGHRRLV